MTPCLVGAAAGTSLYFGNLAYVRAGDEAARAAAIARTAPGAPTGLTAVAGNGQVTLSWTAPVVSGSPHATSYYIYVGTTADFTASTPVAISTSTSVAVTGLANGATYYFRVTAVNAVGQSPASNEASATPVRIAPGAPTGLTAVAGDAQVTLSWTAPASDGAAAIIGYLIYEGTSPGGECNTPVRSSDIAGYTFTATAGSGTVTGLANGTAYYFRVAAVNDLNAVGLMSNEASATPVASDIGPPPPAPQTVCGAAEAPAGPFLCMVGRSQGLANAAFMVRGTGFDPRTAVTVTLIGLNPANTTILDITSRVHPMVGPDGTFSFAISAVYPGSLQLGAFTVDVHGAGGRRASTEFFVIPSGGP